MPGPKAYNKESDEIPTLTSASILKIMNTFNASMRSAEPWRYTKRKPKAMTPPVKSQARQSWSSAEVKETLDKIRDPQLHLLVHITFICSLRAGEAAGIELDQIDLSEGSLQIKQELERVTDEALAKIPKQDIYYIFPKKVKSANTSLILKSLKTQGSFRKAFLPAPLVDELRARILQIEKQKEFYGDGYNKRNMLFCLENGDPQEPRRLVKKWVKWQKENEIPNIIDMQGLRKSGQTHKVNVTGNNYQVVAEAGGQSTKVLFSNYLAVHEQELIDLRDMVEDDFYGSPDPQKKNKLYVQSILERCQADPEFLTLLLKGLQAGQNVPPSSQHTARAYAQNFSL